MNTILTLGVKGISSSNSIELCRSVERLLAKVVNASVKVRVTTGQSVVVETTDNTDIPTIEALKGVARAMLNGLS